MLNGFNPRFIVIVESCATKMSRSFPADTKLGDVYDGVAALIGAKTGTFKVAWLSACLCYSFIDDNSQLGLGEGRIPIPHDDTANALHDLDVVDSTKKYTLYADEIDDNPIVLIKSGEVFRR